MRPLVRTCRLGVAGSLAAGLLVGGAGSAGAAEGPFEYAGGMDAALNAADPTQESVAEISTLTKNGDTLIYTDAAQQQIGFVDVSDPAAPHPAGSFPVGGEPTSVYATNSYVVVVVDTSTTFTQPSGKVVLLGSKSLQPVAELELGGQPDSIDITGNGKTAVIAIENQRDEDVAPDGGAEGDLPQAPAGELAVIDLNGIPAQLSVQKVPLTGLAGLDTPQDPEPEYVSISPDDTRAAVTLQENNAIAVLDLKTRTITASYSAGIATVDGVDTVEDGVIDPSGSITAPREPDAIAWIDNGHLATADEGDWKGGTRGWTVFDAMSGEIVWEAGNAFENLAIDAGRYPENRAENKGAEPEGILAATFGGTRYAFVASERASFVAVYDVTDPAAPGFVQLLPTREGPEGLVADEKNGVLYVSSESDDPEGDRAGVEAFTFVG